jgi:hypothetical protein
MVRTLLNLADRVATRIAPEAEAEASCACPGENYYYCYQGGLYEYLCCSWNCAVAPSCDTYYVGPDPSC